MSNGDSSSGHNHQTMAAEKFLQDWFKIMEDGQTQIKALLKHKMAEALSQLIHAHDSRFEQPELDDNCKVSATDVEEILDSMKLMSGRIDSINQDILNFYHAQQELGEGVAQQLESLAGRLQMVEASVPANLEASLQRTSDTLQTLDGQSVTLTGKVHKVTDRLTNEESGSFRLRAELVDQERHIKDLQNQITAMRSRLAGQDKRDTSYREELKENKQLQTELEHKVLKKNESLVTQEQLSVIMRRFEAWLERKFAHIETGLKDQGNRFEERLEKETKLGRLGGARARMSAHMVISRMRAELDDIWSILSKLVRQAEDPDALASRLDALLVNFEVRETCNLHTVSSTY